jgi:4'-phosphopantetheinyl transferase
MTGEGVTIRWGHLDDHGADRFEPRLSPDERDRAAAFRFERDRRRYVAARGLLRTVLGERLDEDPGRISFAYGERGKPRLAGETGLRFNVSHSHGVVAIALCEGRELGVDVEARRDGLHIERIGRRFLPPDAVSEIEGRTGEDRSREFFRLWVRQEALAKASGAGLERIAERPDSERWSILDLDLVDGYAAALAVERLPVDRGEELIADAARLIDLGSELGQVGGVAGVRAA